MATVGILRTKDGIPSSADDAYLTIRDAAGTVMYGESQVLPSSPGQYSVTLNLGPGAYTAYWRFLIAGFPDDLINRLFYLDQPVVVTDGVNLMQIERQVARRLGPYFRFRAGPGSSIDRFAAGRLASKLNLGTYEDQYILRRGVTTANLRVPLFDDEDRVRIVSQYDTANGYLYNDRNWTYGPDVGNGELIEVLYLDPEFELRPNVLDGLKRCFFWDTFTVAMTETGLNPKISVNQMAPWITNPSQIRSVGYALANTRLAPKPLSWWRVGREGKNITVWTQGALAGNISLLALRPVHTLVNEEMSLAGPNDDLDMVYGELDYLTWACIVELWKNQPERLQPLVKEGLRTDLKAAAAEFSKKSLIIASQQPETFQIDFGNADLTSQIANLPELAL